MRRLPLVLAAALAGCGMLAPRPDHTRFYVLAAPSVPERPADERAAGVIVGLGPVTLPSYLARPEVATRVGPNQITYSPVARWAEPLHSTVAHVLARTVEAELGAGEVLPFPSFGAARLDYAVEVDVRRFESNGDGAATLAAFWSIRDARSRTVLVTRATSLTEHAASPDTAAAVAALSQTLGGLGREIAAGVRQAQARRPGGAAR